MDTVDRGGCPSQKKQMTHYLKYNYYKLYISGKVMKCAIRQNYVVLA